MRIPELPDLTNLGPIVNIQKGNDKISFGQVMLDEKYVWIILSTNEPYKVICSIFSETRPSITNDLVTGTTNGEKIEININEYL